MPTTHQKNTKVEERMTYLGIHAYRATQAKYRATGRGSTTDACREALSRAVGAYTEAIWDWVSEIKITHRGLRADVALMIAQLPDLPLIAMLSAKAFIDAACMKKRLPRACIMAATLLEDELRFREFKGKDALYFDLLKKATQKWGRGYWSQKCSLISGATRMGIQTTKWTIEQRLRLGMTLCHLFIKSTGLLKKIRVLERKHKTILYITPAEELMEWIREYDSFHELLRPFYLPMKVKPVDWVDGLEKGGGYDSKGLKYPLIKRYDRHGGSFFQQRMPKVIDAVNRVQDTGWRINRKVMEILRVCWEADNEMAGLPPRDNYPLPEKPVNIATDKEARRIYARNTAKAHHINQTNTSRRLMISKLLLACDEMGEDTFFFPVQLDFRGRLYYVPQYLNPQGTDFARGLLEFSDTTGESSVATTKWLDVHGANCWGMGRESFEDRQQWVRDNREHIQKSAEAPLDYTWWADAKQPWQFLAFCLDYVSPERGSRLPVYLDASSNGLQILSLLSLDEVGAELTNLVPLDKPNDIYSFIADKILAEVRTHLGDEPLAAVWTMIGIDRDLMKKPVMSMPYGGTQYTIRGQLEEHLIESTAANPAVGEALGDKTPYTASSWLAGIAWKVIKRELGRAVDVMDYVRKVGDVQVALGKPIKWRTPSGFIFEQAYVDTKKITVSTVLDISYRATSLIHKDLDTLSIRKNRKAVSPNFIHSIDASILHLAVGNLPYPVATVHDAFALHATNMDAFMDKLRETYVDIFNNFDLLKDFSESMVGAEKAAELGPVKKFNFFVDKIRRATYAFH